MSVDCGHAIPHWFYGAIETGLWGINRGDGLRFRVLQLSIWVKLGSP